VPPRADLVRWPQPTGERKSGVRLPKEAEDWARSQGCQEMASDTWLDNLDSQRVHEALGFEEVERSVLYRKSL